MTPQILISASFALLLFSASAFAEKIIFASPGDLPPKIYTENGDLKGTYVDIVREICKRLGVEPEFESYPWARAVAMAKSGKVHAIFPPLKNKERTEYLYFPSEPMSITRNVIFARKKRAITIKRLEDLKGFIVGINDQYSYGDKFDAYKKDLILDLSLNEELLVNKLARNSDSGMRRIDVAAASEEAFNFISKRLGFRDEFKVIYVISEEPSYVAFAKAKGKTNKTLSEQFNKALRHLKDEGFVQKINDKYLK